MVLAVDYEIKLMKDEEFQALSKEKQFAEEFYADILKFKSELEKAEQLKTNYDSFSNSFKKKINKDGTTSQLLSYLVSTSREGLTKCKGLIENVYEFMSPIDMVLRDKQQEIFKEELEKDSYKDNQAINLALFDSKPLVAQAFEYRGNQSSDFHDLGKIVDLSLINESNNDFQKFSHQINLVDTALNDYIKRNKNLEYFKNGK